MTKFTDSIVREAKSCYSKEAWENFFNKNKLELSSNQNSKLISSIFSLLQNDPQSLGYDSIIWATLLNSCLSCWDLDLGNKISKYTHSIPSAQIAIPAAKIYLENGSPSTARKVALRALRLVNTDSTEKLHLQMIITNCYIEEGNHTMAFRLLRKMELQITLTNLTRENLADLLVNMARAQFFLGKYQIAAQIYQRATRLYIKLKNWDAATKGFYNAAACYDNSGVDYQENAFNLIAKCKKLSEKYNLLGPLSHCYSFYATTDYNQGNFHKALENYRKALEYTPVSDKSFRRLHILSMSALTHLKLGQFQLGSKVGKQTLELARLDNTERFRSRYLNLEAELLWFEGKIDESQLLLEEAIKPFMANGVNTLEELSTLSSYYLQCSCLDKSNIYLKYKIPDQLSNNTVPWLEYLFALSQLYLSKQDFDNARTKAERCYLIALEFNYNYFIILGLLSLIQIKLAQDVLDEELDFLVKEFEMVCERMGDAPCRVYIYLISASIAYKKGNIAEVKKWLQNGLKLKRIDYIHGLVLNSWIETLKGHSSRLHFSWQIKIVAHYTKIYFAPKMELISDKTFKISNNYTVCLNRNHILYHLIEFLLKQNGYTATPSELQKNVWAQSLSTQGWEQKVRNTIMRIRYVFNYTIAPLILHSGNQVRLYNEAIKLKPIKKEEHNIDSKILHLLAKNPMSTTQLAKQIKTSQATTKRILKRLTENLQVTVSKRGRQVYYHTPPPESQ